MPHTVGTPFDLGAVGLGGTHGEVALLDNGNLFVVWANTVNAFFETPGTDDNGTAVTGRIVGPDGTPVTDIFQINQTEPFFQQDAEITVLDNGNVVVAWTDTPFGDLQTEARARIYTADGTPVTDELTLATETDGDQRIPQIAPTPDGGFLAIWNDDRSEAFGRYFNADGSPAGDDFMVPSFFGERLAMVVLPDGGVRYVSANQLWIGDGSLFTSTSGHTHLLASSNSSQNTSFSNNFETAMALLPDGKYVMAGVRGVGSEFQIAARVRDPANFDNAVIPPNGMGADIILSDDTIDVAAQNLVNVDVTPLSDGGFVVTWGQYTGDGQTLDFEVRARIVGPDLNTIGEEISVFTPSGDGAQSQPFVVERADGDIFIGWTDESEEIGDEPFSIVGAIIQIDESGGGAINPTDGPDTLVGTDGPDTINGLDGDDVIAGKGGDDSLDGGGGNDVISGSGGNDTIFGSNGDDNIGGGLGDDNITGDTGNDTIGAGQGNDQASGGQGDDGVFGGAGNDTLDGGVGNDTMGAGFNDDLVSGGDGDDLMGGGTGKDWVDGQGGNDALGGGEGDDTVIGGLGDDTVNGGGRDDMVNGGIGDDQVNGGAGSDTMIGGEGADIFVFNEFEDGAVDIITDWTDGEDMFRMTGIQNAPGSGLAGKVAALGATQVGDNVEMSYGGNTIILENADVNDIGVEDFLFL